MIKYSYHLGGILVFMLFSATLASGLKGQNRLLDGEENYRLYIKISPLQRVDVEQGKLVSFNNKRSFESELFEKLSHFSFTQLVDLSSYERSHIRSNQKRTRVTNDFDRTQFSGLVELEESKSMDKYTLLSLAQELEQFNSVEYCELVPCTPAAPPSLKTQQRTTVRAVNENWESDQFYLFGVNDTDENIVGIYADYAWSKGIFGQGVSIADIEYGWTFSHEEFAGQNVINALPTTNHSFDDHGTAVMGEMYAANNGWGVTGAVHGADAFYCFSETAKGRPGAILAAIDTLKAGDVLVYEMQTRGPTSQYVPADYFQSVWDVTKSATEAGIIVVAAAGNGNQNLD